MATAAEGHEHSSLNSYDRKSKAGGSGGKFVMRAACPVNQRQSVNIRKLGLRGSTSGEDEGLSPDTNDSELDAVQSSSPNLDNEASKQKVILRQKGSLAKRRKPSRNSLRVQSADCDHYADTLADELNKNADDEEGSAEEKGDKCKDGEEEERKEVTDEKSEDVFEGREEFIISVEDRQRAPTTPPPDPVHLPGLGQSVKLKKSVSVSSGISAGSMSPPPEVVDLSKIQLRKTHSVSEASAVTTEENQEGGESRGQPDWLKEARAKKKRVAEKLPQESDKKDEGTEEDPGPSPWLKDRKLRKVTAPVPFKIYSSHEQADNILPVLSPKKKKVPTATLR